MTKAASVVAVLAPLAQVALAAVAAAEWVPAERALANKAALDPTAPERWVECRHAASDP